MKSNDSMAQAMKGVTKAMGQMNQKVYGEIFYCPLKRTLLSPKDNFIVP